MALFNPGDVLFEINPIHLVLNYSVPVDIDAVLLIIKPLVSKILTLGDISQTKVIFKGAINLCCLLMLYSIFFFIGDHETTVEWTSSVYRGFENNGYIVAALSISAPSSFSFNVTINPYELSNGLVSNLSSALTVALGWYFIVLLRILISPFIILGNDIDFQSDPFNVTVPKYSINVTINVPIYSDRIVSYKKAFGLKFYISKSIKITSGPQSESIAEILNTDGKCLYKS